MASSPTARDRFRLAVAAVSGLTAIAAVSATGWLAGTMAHSAEADQATAPPPDAPARADRVSPPRTVALRPRPHRTHVTVHYVQGTPSAPVGTGGTVSQPVVHAPSAPAPAPHPAAAPPPPPAPAPSSGS